ncbi:MAG TPA: cytochrome c biogenesis protein CcsA [Ktedonobacteraceae bacterium]|nr:cytochrome c biogenesis protein CcsA [Ktedonobacteraceae bacterium]
MALANKQTHIEQQAVQQGGPAATTRLPLVSLILLALTTIGMMVSIGLIFLVAPTDAIEGLPQRIFYFHVPVSWIGMLAFGVLAAASIAYLWKKDERWDWLARASAEIGTVFITLALVTGSIWGRTTWGTWWTWDARLTTTLILWFIYIGYMMLRSYMGRTHASARSAAVLGIIGFIDVPIIYESVNWWRTLHPQPEVGTPGALPPEVVGILMVSLVTFTLLYCFLMVQLYQLEKTQTLAQRLRASLE